MLYADRSIPRAEYRDVTDPAKYWSVTHVDTGFGLPESAAPSLESAKRKAIRSMNAKGVEVVRENIRLRAAKRAEMKEVLGV